MFETKKLQIPSLRRNRSPVSTRRRPQSFVSPMITPNTVDNQQQSISNDSTTSNGHLLHQQSQSQHHQQIASDHRWTPTTATYAVPETGRDDRNRSSAPLVDDERRRLIDVASMSSTNEGQKHQHGDAIAASHREVAMMQLIDDNVANKHIDVGSQSMVGADDGTYFCFNYTPTRVGRIPISSTLMAPGNC